MQNCFQVLMRVKKCKISLGILMKMLADFTVSFKLIYRYWNQVNTKHENLFSISLESEEKQGRG